MGSIKKILKKLVGTPPAHKDEKKEHKVVETPEFDITQYAKKLGVTIGVIVTAVFGTLKGFNVAHITDAIVVGALGVTAAALLGVSFVMATDLAARAYLSGEGSASKKKTKTSATVDGEERDSAEEEIIAVPEGMQVWLKEGDGPHPVLAMSGDGKEVSSYLIATGSTHERDVDGKQVKAFDGTVKWFSADEIQAIRADKWP
jgi:hypothetical protein